MEGKEITMETQLDKGGWVVSTKDGTHVTVRPDSNASWRTGKGTATVEINNEDIRAKNKGKLLKYKISMTDSEENTISKENSEISTSKQNEVLKENPTQTPTKTEIPSIPNETMLEEVLPEEFPIIIE